MSSAAMVDIIIVTWKTRDLTCRCVENVIEKTSNEAISAHIYVVDNYSQDGTVSTLRSQYPDITVIENNRNAGFSVANNIAIRCSKAPFLLLLNSDAFLKNNCLTRLLSTIKSDPVTGAVGPRLVLPSGAVQHSVTQITSPWSQLGYLLAFHFPPLSQKLKKLFHKNRDTLVLGTAPRHVPLLSAACLLVRREVFDKVGLLPEDRFLYSEEDDLFFRMKKAGYRSIYLPSAEALHICGESSSKNVETVRNDDHFSRSRLKFLFQHYPQYRFFTFITHIFFYSWSCCVCKLKTMLRDSETDKIYYANARLLVSIVLAEYRLARDSKIQYRQSSTIK